MKFVRRLLALFCACCSVSGFAADTEVPAVQFTYPTHEMTLTTNWSAIQGTVIDNSGGVDHVTISILAPDGRFWDGTQYVTDPVALTTTITNATNWSRLEGLPRKFDLQTGPYTIFADAVDVAGNAGAASIIVSMNVPPPPPNDDFVDAPLLSGIQGAVQGTTAGGTREPGEPNHAFLNGVASIWYRWTAPDRGILTLDTTGSGFDTLLAVYTGNSVSNLTLIESDHGSGQFGGSRLATTIVPGTTYSIAIDGRDGLGENSYGNSTLSWELVVTEPTVRINRVNAGTLAIAWSAAAQGFTLQTTPALSPASWGAGPAAVRQGDDMVATVPSSGAAAYFRLQKSQ